ncbi:MAG: hypothetical protein PHW60_11925 [Kiritimatiellae bacterium]|nr:hypothetical protein [Kiritimatiellia bacterium]
MRFLDFARNDGRRVSHDQALIWRQFLFLVNEKSHAISGRTLFLELAASAALIIILKWLRQYLFRSDRATSRGCVIHAETSGVAAPIPANMA